MYGLRCFAVLINVEAVKLLFIRRMCSQKPELYRNTNPISQQRGLVHEFLFSFRILRVGKIGFVSLTSTGYEEFLHFIPELLYLSRHCMFQRVRLSQHPSTLPSPNQKKVLSETSISWFLQEAHWKIHHGHALQPRLD